MRTIVVNETIFSTADDLHAYLATRLDFPSYYGNNLDALQDCLGDIDDDVRFYVVRTPHFEVEENAWFDRFCRVFERATNDNPHIDYIPCRMLV